MEWSWGAPDVAPIASGALPVGLEVYAAAIAFPVAVAGRFRSPGTADFPHRFPRLALFPVLCRSLFLVFLRHGVLSGEAFGPATWRAPELAA